MTWADPNGGREVNQVVLHDVVERLGFVAEPGIDALFARFGDIGYSVARSP